MDVLIYIWAVVATVALSLVVGMLIGKRLRDMSVADILRPGPPGAATGWQPDLPAVIAPEPSYEERASHELTEKSMENIREGLIREHNLGGKELEDAMEQIREAFGQHW